MAVSDHTHKILIADDSTILNNMLRDVFEEHGYEVLQAFGGSDCKTLFLKEKPDVVLVDGRMPTSDCIEVLKYIKQRSPRTVTVIMTAPGNEFLALRALKLGADDYLQKPFGTDEVLALVAKLLEKRKSAEEAAKLNSRIVRQDRYLAELTTVINEALITTDPKGRVQFINRAGSQMWGYSPEELKGEDVHLLIRGESRTLLYRNLVNDTLQKGKVEGEFLFRKKDKGTFPGYLSSSIIREHQRIKGIVFVVADLTRVYDVEARLKQSEKLASLGRVAEGIAHEVRNTLTSLGGFSARLHKLYGADQAIGQYTSIIMDDVKRLERMVQTIEDYVKFARFYRFRFEPTRIPPLVESARDRVLMNISDEKKKSVVFNMRIEDGFPAIHADATALQEVFYQLILNAYEAMPRGGRLNVILKRADSAVSIAFSDTGVGIDSSSVEDIFNPFFTAKTKGAGMGLSKVHLLVEEHRGAIHVHSTPKKGTTFEVLLPIERFIRGVQP